MKNEDKDLEEYREDDKLEQIVSIVFGTFIVGFILFLLI